MLIAVESSKNTSLEEYNDRLKRVVSQQLAEFNTRNPESSQSTTSRNTSGESQLSAVSESSKNTSLEEYNDRLKKVVSQQLADFNNRNPESSQSTTSHNTSGESQLSADVKRLQDIIVQHAPEPQKAPTHLEASLVKWNEMRRILNENTITGMATRKLSLGDRPTLLPSVCQLCQQPLIRKAVTHTLKVISVNGLTEVVLNIPGCEPCSWAPVQTCQDFPKVGLWPLTPEGKTFVDFSYLLHMTVLQHDSPSLSMASMLSSLKFLTEFDGKGKLSISQDTFNCCLKEWKKAEAAFFDHRADSSCTMKLC
ncbi:hypothetical protein EB796_017715 [Bugula neritina]|uniref:CxC3 like cysteine cluster domain-containing protein n=1 Tax=Bugula neritina TaxID=10212 RepID=A0A7J7JEB0_BUGNE|nr:hypothetical protein EB796_017715 [Bugula neritina]